MKMASMESRMFNRLLTWTSRQRSSDVLCLKTHRSANKLMEEEHLYNIGFNFFVGWLGKRVNKLNLVEGLEYRQTVRATSTPGAHLR